MAILSCSSLGGMGVSKLINVASFILGILAPLVLSVICI